jgi:hypothetical protein
VELPRDAQGEVARLLRGVAAVIAGAYVVGLVIGESARPLSADPLSMAFCACVALVLLPFMLPSRWFRGAPSLLHAWMIAGAIVASARAAFMAGWLFPRLPLSSWLTKLILDLVLVAALWAAAIANRQSPIFNRANRQSTIGNQ